MGTNVALSQFTLLLESGQSSGDFTPFIEYLKSMPPAKADLEIRSLNHSGHKDHSELLAFIRALSSRLFLKRDFELVNAWMAVLLNVHADTIARCSQPESGESKALKDALTTWCHAQQREGQRLAGMVGYCRGVVGFLRSSR